MMRDERWNKKWDLFPLHSVDDPLNQCAPRHIHPIENRCSRHMFIITPWQVSHLRPAQIKTEGFKCVSVWWHPHKFWGLAKSKNFFLLFGHVGILGSSSFIQHYHEPVNWVLRLFSFFCPWGKINVNGSQFFSPTTFVLRWENFKSHLRKVTYWCTSANQRQKGWTAQWVRQLHPKK